MKHYGDITKINGAKVEPVYIITGGSPCQDLSVAGKRAGLAGERSGLFIEQIRIIKEMRENDRASGRADEHIRPRYMVWENVTGAFSSNGGEDFRVVLEETARVAGCDTSIPRLPAGTDWADAGCILGDGWSIAWRVHDAQFWGVPQRRKRVALVADFGGQTAPEILFERKGLSGNNEAIRKQRKTIAPDTSNGIGAAKQSNVIVLENHPQDSRMKIKEDGIFQTMGARQGAETDPHTLMVLENHPNDSRCKISRDGIVQTLSGRMGTGGGNTPMVLEKNGTPKTDHYRIRRLTPKECERLQGFPDDWTNIGAWVDSKGKTHKGADAPRYKALGNSIALPFWQWMAERMVRQLNVENPTMASLFDGIGGFPLVYSRCGCKPVWASEIEEFPIAVTKKHFGKD